MKELEMLIKLRSLIFVLLSIPYIAVADSFVDAQTAAKEGRYRDVVDILSATLEDPALELKWQVIGHSNRGIAYSLLDAYALADKDLSFALSLDPKHTLTLNQLGLLADRVKHDPKLAASYYQRAVDLDYAGAMVNLGELYREGRGINVNANKAFNLLLRAANRDYPNAFGPLGVMYARGEGTNVNSKEAFKYYKKGAEYGIAVSYYRLGLAYERGWGTGVNLVEAFRNYRFAAVQGHGEAQSALGYMYKRGRGTTKDISEAVRWYELAAVQDVASANNRLAWLLATCPTKQICDGERAVILVKKSIELVEKIKGKERHKDNFDKSISSMSSMLDTLAAAYARAGKFDAAVNTMDGLLESIGRNSAQRAVFLRRLALYKSGKPYPK